MPGGIHSTCNFIGLHGCCVQILILKTAHINKPSSDCHYLKTDVPDSLECKIMNNFRVIVSPSTREEQVFNHSKVAINIECGACLEKKEL